MGPFLRKCRCFVVETEVRPYRIANRRPINSYFANPLVELEMIECDVLWHRLLSVAVRWMAQRPLVPGGYSDATPDWMGRDLEASL